VKCTLSFIDVVLEDDATPFVMIIATQLRRAIADPALAKKAAGLRGTFALKSQKDPQAVTMRFDRGTVALTRGVAPDCQVVATVDLDNMSGPDAAKPKVTGALRRPLFALGVSKLLDPPSQSWAEHAQAFWDFAGAHPGMPIGMRIICLDDNTALELGVSGEGAGFYEIQGGAVALTSIFSGNSAFGQDLVDGKVFARGSLQHSSVLTGRSVEWALRGAA
jgi:hypothetical protein